MNLSHELALLLITLAKHELDAATSCRMSLVVESNNAELEQVRDDLWRSGDHQTATEVDRLISSFHPQCQSPLAAAEN